MEEYEMKFFTIGGMWQKTLTHRNGRMEKRSQGKMQFDKEQMKQIIDACNGQIYAFESNEGGSNGPTHFFKVKVPRDFKLDEKE